MIGAGVKQLLAVDNIIMGNSMAESELAQLRR